MNFEIIENPLDNIYILKMPNFNDKRGNFVKVFRDDEFRQLGINFIPKEQFVSTSKENTLRGMHFQVNKSSQQKFVVCIKGEILDVIVDVRKESINFNKPICFNLNSEDSLGIFIGKGYAHGFLCLKDNTTVNYLTDTVHNSADDKGILWSSINFKWPKRNFIISERDQKHPRIGKINYSFF